MMFVQSQPHLMHSLKLSGLPIFLDFDFSSNINLHLFLVTVSHVVQNTAASSCFECGFHDGCSKSTSFDAFPEFAGLLSFHFFFRLEHKPTFCCLSYCKPHRSKNERFKSFRVWVPLCLFQVDLIWCNPSNLQVVWFSYIFFELEYKSSSFFELL